MSDAVEVVQVAGTSNANAKLAEGWKLFAVLPGKVQGTGFVVVMYVLGKPAPKPNPPYIEPSDWRTEALENAAVAFVDIE